MKTFLCLMALIVTAVPAASQTIFIVNNNPGPVPGTNVFTGNSALADAIAAAAGGDIIYVVPSGSLYNAVLVDRCLAIYGAGFNPDKTNSVTSKCQNISITLTTFVYRDWWSARWFRSAAVSMLPPSINTG